MNFQGNSQNQELTLRNELVPNYHSIIPAVRTRIDDVLTLLSVCTQKSMIQSFSRMGLFEQTPLLRSHIWKLLLESLPFKQNWKQNREQNKMVYTKLLERQGFGIDEDLLELGEATPQENMFDKELWDEVMLDSVRTHSMMNFFQQEVKSVRVYSNKPTKHLDILNRILYVWAKVNGSVRYVQGMNELIAPLYFLEFQVITQYSESEVFYMFSSLITPLLDMHIKDMDKSSEGINGRMMELNKHLKMVDYEVWKKLEDEGVHPQYYSFRWLALMLSQEFGLCQTTQLWDCLLSYDGLKRYKYLYCLCLSILKIRKKQILASEFTQIIPRLQKIKDIDIHQMIQISNKLYDKIIKVDVDKILKRQEDQRNSQNMDKKPMSTKIYDAVYKKTGEFLNNLAEIKTKFSK